jgi:hypothetical protein
MNVDEQKKTRIIDIGQKEPEKGFYFPLSNNIPDDWS